MTDADKKRKSELEEKLSAIHKVLEPLFEEMRKEAQKLEKTVANDRTGYRRAYDDIYQKRRAGWPAPPRQGHRRQVQL